MLSLLKLQLGRVASSPNDRHVAGSSPTLQSFQADAVLNTQRLFRQVRLDRDDAALRLSPLCVSFWGLDACI
jgi:hypothetical protein